MNMSALIKNIEDKYEEYLKDESRLAGEAASISFPETEQQVVDIVSSLAKMGVPITVQGARTGIAGGAVPKGGHILNLSKMTAIHGLKIGDDGFFQLEVQPGLLLSELTTSLKRKHFEASGWSEEARDANRKFTHDGLQFFPPDPTETTATLGGMFACNAAGMNDYFYGSTARYVTGIRVALITGEIWELDRGAYIFNADGCPLPNGKYLRLNNLVLKQPISKVMTVSKGMDLIDLFAGSEGMLGVITRLKIKLLPDPKAKWGIVFFFQESECAFNFVQLVQQQSSLLTGVNIVALEFFDQNTLKMIQQFKTKATRLKEIPDIGSQVAAAIYMELHANDDEVLEAALPRLSEVFSKCGGEEEATWAASGNTEIEKLKVFRHAAPESVNTKIDEMRRSDSRITKLGADMSAPQEYLSRTIKMYRNDLDACGLYGIIFGHVGSNHLHVDIIPEDYGQYQKGLDLLDRWAKSIVELGGVVTAENGVGKLKKKIYLDNVSGEQLRMAREIKDFFDPDGLLNPSNMLYLEER